MLLATYVRTSAQALASATRACQPFEVPRVAGHRGVCAMAWTPVSFEAADTSLWTTQRGEVRKARATNRASRLVAPESIRDSVTDLSPVVADLNGGPRSRRRLGFRRKHGYSLLLHDQAESLRRRERHCPEDLPRIPRKIREDLMWVVVCPTRHPERGGRRARRAGRR